MAKKLELKRENWTDAVAWLWGDTLELGRPATFDEACANVAKNGFSVCADDYFNDDGSYKGPCALGISVTVTR